MIYNVVRILWAKIMKEKMYSAIIQNLRKMSIYCIFWIYKGIHSFLRLLLVAGARCALCAVHLSLYELAEFWLFWLYPFGVLPLKDFFNYKPFHLLTFSVPDEGYSRNVSCMKAIFQERVTKFDIYVFIDGLQIYLSLFPLYFYVLVYFVLLCFTYFGQ